MFIQSWSCNKEINIFSERNRRERERERERENLEFIKDEKNYGYILKSKSSEIKEKSDIPTRMRKLCRNLKIEFYFSKYVL